MQDLCEALNYGMKIVRNNDSRGWKLDFSTFCIVGLASLLSMFNAMQL